MKLGICIHCGKEFVRTSNSQRVCSVLCSVWRYIPIGDPTKCWLWQGGSINAGGYPNVRYNKKDYRVSRIIAGAMTGEVVMHKCDNPACCNHNHLMIGTQLDNMIDMAKKGRSARGEMSLSPLSELDVRTIRSIGKSKSSREIGERYGVSGSTIRRILLRNTWKHI